MATGNLSAELRKTLNSMRKRGTEISEKKVDCLGWTYFLYSLKQVLVCTDVAGMGVDNQDLDFSLSLGKIPIIS